MSDLQSIVDRMKDKACPDWRGILRAQKTEAMAEKRWPTYISLHSKRERLEAFKNIEGELTDEEYWNLLRGVWTGIEHTHLHLYDWMRMLLIAPRPQRHLFMAESDRTFLESLPSTFTIYRGYQPGGNRQGLSWTLSKEVAEFMSNFGVDAGTDIKITLTGGKVRQRTVLKSEVFAYLNERSEQEIIFFGD